MQLKMFSIRDAKAEAFNNPFFKHTHGEAERDFHQACQDDKSMLNKYPEDYDLYFVGTYDTNTGQIVPLDTPQHMTKAISVLNRKS